MDSSPLWTSCTGFTDNSSVNVVPTPDGKQLISLTESVAGTYRLDMDLNTLGQLKFQDGVKGLLTTAHPTLLPDGSMINLTSGVRRHFCAFAIGHVLSPIFLLVSVVWH